METQVQANVTAKPDFSRSAERDIIQRIFEERWDNKDAAVITYEECAKATGKPVAEATMIMRQVKQHLQDRFRDPKYFVAIPTVGYEAAVNGQSHKSVVNTGANKARNQAKRNFVCANALLSDEEKANELTEEERKQLTLHAAFSAAHLELTKSKTMKRLANKMPENFGKQLGELRGQLEYFQEAIEE